MGAFFVGDGTLDVPLIKLFLFCRNLTPRFFCTSPFLIFVRFFVIRTNMGRGEQCSPVSFTANHLP